MSRGLMLIALVMFVFGWFSSLGAADNTGLPLYDTDRNPVTTGVYLGDSLPGIRWIQVDSTGVPIVAISGGAISIDSMPSMTVAVDSIVYVTSIGSIVSTVTTQEERLYPYFMSGIVDSTMVDSLYSFYFPTVSFWLRNASSADTLYASWWGPSFPSSYITIPPLSSLGLEHIARPDSLNGLYLDSSVDSLPWELIVLSDSLFVPVVP